MRAVRSKRYSIVNVNTPLGTEQRGLRWEPIANLGCSAGLAGCNLKGVALAGAYLAGANLSGANLKGRRFPQGEPGRRGSHWIRTSKMPFSVALRSRAHISRERMSGRSGRNTICPDGTNSDSNGGTCIGHLLDRGAPAGIVRSATFSAAFFARRCALRARVKRDGGADPDLTTRGSAGPTASPRCDVRSPMPTISGQSRELDEQDSWKV